MPYIRCAIGFILGLTLGSLLLPESVLAQFGRAAVTWTAESCPPGRYVITAIATNLGTGRTIERRTKTVFPRGAFETEFGKAPHGHYIVRVEARRTDGLTFTSSQQMTIGAGSLAAVTTGVAELSVQGLQKPSVEAPVTRFARPRPSPVTPPLTGTHPARSVNAGGVAGTLAVMHKLNELAAAGHTWRQAQLLDVDEDGHWDAVAIEFNDGAVLSWILPGK